jgi:hypothetical protein
MTDYIKRWDAIGLAKDIVVPCGEKIGNHTTKPIIVFGFIDPDEVMELPSEDVVEVVRCKDCRNRGKTLCPIAFTFKELTEEMDYCSFGERA